MKNSQIEVIIILTIEPPRKFNFYPTEWYNALIDEFTDFASRITFSLLPIDKEHISIEICNVERVSEIYDINQHIDKNESRFYKFALIRIGLKINHQKVIAAFKAKVDKLKEYYSQKRSKIIVLDITEDISSDEIKELFVETLVEEISFLISKIFLIVNLAKPGVFTLSNSIILSNNQLKAKLPRISSELFDTAYNSAEEFKWPNLSGIPIVKAWDWANKIEGFTRGVSLSRTGRALAALSYIIVYPSSYEQGYTEIIWPIIGLEALYAKSSIGTKLQILEKSEVFLGKRGVHKKKFGLIYDFRSRFLHGDIDFNYSFVEPDSHFRSEEFMYESIEAHNIATSILLATLQKMILLDIHDLEFTYILNSI
jgi:hypothetical protein